MKSQVEQVAARWDGTNVRRASGLAAGVKKPEVRELRKIVLQGRRDVCFLIDYIQRLEDVIRSTQQAVGQAEQGPSPLAD